MGTITRSTKAGGSTNIADGQTAVAADVNTDTNTIVTEINGEIDDANIKTAELPGAKSLRFSEIAAQANPGANDIVLHAIEQSGTRLTMRDSAGTLAVLGTGAQIIRKTAETQVRNNSTTLQDDDALLAALAANETVYFAAWVIHVGNVTADIKFAFTVPAGAALAWADPNASLSTASTLQTSVYVTTSGGVLSYAGGATSLTQLLVGIVRNGSTAGNLQLQWAQNTATAADIKVRTDSFLMVWRA